MSMNRKDYMSAFGHENLIGNRAKILPVEHYIKGLHGAVGTIECVNDKLFLRFDEKIKGMEGVYLTSDAF